MSGFFGRKVELNQKKDRLDVRPWGDDDDEDEDAKEDAATDQKMAERNERRLSALEDAEYARLRLDEGGVKIGSTIVARGGCNSLWQTLMYGSLFSYGREPSTEKREGVMIGSANTLRSGKGVNLTDPQAIALRDWLLKEFPLELPKPSAEKAVKK